MTTKSEVQGVVIALFGAYAGGYLAELTAEADAGNLDAMTTRLTSVQGIILGEDLSSDAVFADTVLANFGVTSDNAAYAAASGYFAQELAAGASRAAVVNAAVMFLNGIAAGTIVDSNYSAIAAAFAATVETGVLYSEGDGSVELSLVALQTAAGNAPVVEGQTFTLTTGTDAVFGTAGDDTVNGTDTTYTAADIITDSSASDNDTLNITAATDIAATPTVVGFENVNFTASGTLAGGDTTFTVDVANVKGGADITVDTSNADTLIAQATVNNIVDGTTLTTGSKMATVVAAIAADANVTINAQATAVSLSTTGASKNLTVAGDGDVTITASAAKGDLTVSGKVLDVTAASALGAVVATATGDATVTVAAAKGKVTVTSGEDIVDADGAAATSVELSAVGAIAAAGDHAIFGEATSATASAGKDSFLDVEKAKAITLTSTGKDGAEVDFTLAAAVVDDLTLAGDSAINVIVDTVDIGAENVINNNTAGAVITLLETTDLTAAADLTGVATSVALRLGADFQSETLTVVDEGAQIQLNAESDQTTAAVTFAAETSTAYATNSINVATADTVTTDTVDVTATVVGLAFTSFATVNLDATNAAFTTTADVTGDKLTKLVITGTKAVTFGANTVTGSATTAATVDASGLAANMSITLDGTANGAETFIGGSKVDTVTVGAAAASGNTFDISTNAGNDVIDVNAAVSLKVDGGSGTDTLDIAALDLSAKTLDLTSVEQITYDDGADLSASFISGKTFLIDSTAGGDDLNIVMNQASVDLSNLAFTTGHADDTVTVDASAVGLATTITGTSQVDVITGGAGADTINAGKGDDTVTGGAGADVITLGAGTDTVVLDDVTAGGIDVIKDFVGGTDIIKTAAGNTTAALALVAKGTLAATTYATFDLAVASFAAAAANATEALKAYTFTYGAHDYLLIDNGVAGYLAGTDTIVEITGLTGTLVAGDIFNA